MWCFKKITDAAMREKFMIGFYANGHFTSQFTVDALWEAKEEVSYLNGGLHPRLASFIEQLAGDKLY